MEGGGSFRVPRKHEGWMLVFWEDKGGRGQGPGGGPGFGRRGGRAGPALGCISLCPFLCFSFSLSFSFLFRRFGEKDKGLPQYDPRWLGTGLGHVAGYRWRDTGEQVDRRLSRRKVEREGREGRLRGKAEREGKERRQRGKVEREGREREGIIFF